MSEAITSKKTEEKGARWDPEGLSHIRLEALLKYTECESVEELQTVLTDLANVLTLLPTRDGRNKFLSRRGGPTKTEYVLYVSGRVLGGDFVKIQTCLEMLGIEIQPIDVLDREFVVGSERGKITLELLNLVAEVDPDSDIRDMGGSNWNAIAIAAMEKAAQEDASEDIPTMLRSQRSFPIKGSSRPQRLHPALRQHFADSLKPEVTEEDPVELDALIDDTAVRFDEGELSLDQAFREWGLEIDEPVDDTRQIIPANKSLGETAGDIPFNSRYRYRWHNGVLFRREKSETSEGTQITPEDLRQKYRQAKPAAELLWDADTLSRKAEYLLSTEGPRREKFAARLRNLAAEKRKLADAMPASLQAVEEVLDIHRGYVFTRVMRFLKRRDVRTASAFGPKDLMQEGLLGLYRALARSNPDSEGSFIGYARHHIDAMMLQLILKHRTFVTLPTRVQSILNQLYDIDDKADTIPENPGEYAISPDARRGRRLALAERIFGEKLNIGTFLERKRREAHQEESSYAVPVTDIDDEKLSAVTLMGDETVVMPEMRNTDILDTKRLLSRIITETLTPREERVIRARFGIGAVNESRGEMTLDEIAEVTPTNNNDGFSVTRTRVAQIEEKAIRKLKRALWLRFGKRDSRGNKYVGMSAIESIFDVGEMRQNV